MDRDGTGRTFFSMEENNNLRTYLRYNCIVFRKTKEQYGGLSNMASGFPICINGISIRTAEALYQACRFPDLPEIQEKIISEKSPMTAKMKGKPYRDRTRSDWNHTRVKIMKWCLRAKLAQNWEKFGELLLSTGDLPIVEESKKDSFWGAKPTEEGKLVGVNALGRLLMELREEFMKAQNWDYYIVKPLEIENFVLLNKPIETITKEIDATNRKPSNDSTQMTLF